MGRRPFREGVGPKAFEGCHQKKVFTPVAKLLKSSLSAADQATLRKASQQTPPLAKETTRFFFVAAGNNLSENLTGHVKNTMRRQGTLGKGTTKKNQPAVQSSKKSLQALSAAGILRKAGFSSVMSALTLYRKALTVQDESVQGVKPKEAWQSTPWLK